MQVNRNKRLSKIRSVGKINNSSGKASSPNNTLARRTNQIFKTPQRIIEEHDNDNSPKSQPEANFENSVIVKPQGFGLMSLALQAKPFNSGKQIYHLQSELETSTSKNSKNYHHLPAKISEDNNLHLLEYQVKSNVSSDQNIADEEVIKIHKESDEDSNFVHSFRELKE
jgi:hypothetical protein